MMNRQEAEDYIYFSYLKAEKNQNYSDLDSQKRHPELSKAILEKLSCVPNIIVTGSKGKGSVVVMLTTILQTQMNVGMMTSPHLTNFCERFKINGINISDEDFARQVEILLPQFDAIQERLPPDWYLSPIAIQTAVALNYFRKKGTQINVLECGKGARYDDVKNVQHDYAVINSIFLEHTRELGGTLEEIAADKSYVITGGQKAVFVADQMPEVMDVIRKRANHFSVPVKVYGKDFRAEHISFTHSGMNFDVRVEDRIYKDITIPLLGVHQAKNCALAFALAQDILGPLNIDEVRNHLHVISWQGRMEIIGQNPLMILDACINRVSCSNVKEVLEYMNISNYSLIVGIPDDKDFAGVVEEMKDGASSIYLSQSNNPHYIFSDNQSTLLAKIGIRTERTLSAEEAITLAKLKSYPIIILGTTSFISDVIAIKNLSVSEHDHPKLRSKNSVKKV